MSEATRYLTEAPRGIEVASNAQCMGIEWISMVFHGFQLPTPICGCVLGGSPSQVSSFEPGLHQHMLTYCAA